MLRFLNGELDQAEQVMAEAQREIGDTLQDASLILEEVRGDVLLARGELTQAASHAEAALAMLDRFGLRVYFPEALRQKGQALLGLGQAQEARATLVEGRRLALEMGLRRPLEKILAALVTLEREAGDEARAEEYRREAAQLIEEMAANVTDADLRASYLARPEARGILGARGRGVKRGA
jgi:tetratricopeptide (TPR) repeat protein